ncbi:Uncharacterised protein [Acinetobacter baumannii]|nr:Uncharacterised protein [Acinetobacter baumannii]
MAKVVLPIDGRAATIIKSPGCIPEVLLSSSKKPVVKPVIFPSNFESSSSLLITSAVTELIALGPESFLLLLCCSAKEKILVSAKSKISLTPRPFVS